MTDDELRALAEAATPGPWAESRRVFSDGSFAIDGIGPIRACWCNDETADLSFDRDGDVEYIKAVSPDVILGLLDRLRGLVPKDQLHQQWGVGIVSDGTIDANANTCATPQAARKLLASLNAIFPDDRRQLVTRWQPGPWRPADSKEQG